MSEISFWTGWLYRNRDSFGLFDGKELFPWIVEMIEDRKTVKIAELGCGAFSLIGRKCEGVHVDLHSSDILADEYKELLEEYNIKSNIEKEDMENLSYPDDSFDIVYCANALDHCLNPYKALQEMIRVCKKGGWVYLRHFICEGRRSRYNGSHSWNVELIDGEHVIWNKSIRFSLSEFPMKFDCSIHRKKVVIAKGRK
jgi:SAM-dependent methyltransferase